MLQNTLLIAFLAAKEILNHCVDEHMVSSDIRPLSKLFRGIQISITVTLLIIVAGCGGGASPPTQVIGPSHQESSTPDLITAEAISGVEPTQSAKPFDQVAENVGIDIEQPSAVTEVNRAPVLPVLKISPEQPVVDSHITVVHETILDPDNDPLLLSYRWYINGELVIDNDTRDLRRIVKKGDQITAELQVSDGIELVSEVAQEVTVQNSTPTIESLTIERVGETAVPRIGQPFDADGDDITYEYKWVKGEFDTPRSTDSILGLNRNEPSEDNIRLWVTVSDGINSKQYRSLSLTDGSELFDVQNVPLELVWGEQVSFAAHFVDNVGNPERTTMVAGPAGIVYSNGVLHWTPKPFMFHPTETYYAYFENDSGDSYRMDLNVHHPLMENPLLLGKGLYEADNVFLDIAGWTGDVNEKDRDFVFIVNNKNEYRGQSVGIVNNSGELSLRRIGNEYADNSSVNAPTGAFVLDANNDSNYEIVVPSGVGKYTVVQYRELNDLALLSEVSIPSEDSNFRINDITHEFDLSDSLIVTAVSDNGWWDERHVLHTSDLSNGVYLNEMEIDISGIGVLLETGYRSVILNNEECFHVRRNIYDETKPIACLTADFVIDCQQSCNRFEYQLVYLDENHAEVERYPFAFSVSEFNHLVDIELLNSDEILIAGRDNLKIVSLQSGEVIWALTNIGTENIVVNDPEIQEMTIHREDNRPDRIAFVTTDGFYSTRIARLHLSQ